MARHDTARRRARDDGVATPVSKGDGPTVYTVGTPQWPATPVAAAEAPLARTIIMSPEHIPATARRANFAVSGVLSPSFRGPIEVRTPPPAFARRTSENRLVDAASPTSFGDFKMLTPARTDNAHRGSVSLALKENLKPMELTAIAEETVRPRPHEMTLFSSPAGLSATGSTFNAYGSSAFC